MEQDPFKNKPTEPQNPDAPVKNTQEQLITFEIAQPIHWEAVKKIRLESFQNSPEAFNNPLEQFNQESSRSESVWRELLLDSERFVLLVKEGTNPTGIAMAAKKVNEKSEEWWRIYGVYLKQKLRRAGTGRKMMEKVIDEIRNRGGYKIILNVSKSEAQIVARTLYGKLGFKLIKRPNEHLYTFSEMELNLGKK